MSEEAKTAVAESRTADALAEAGDAAHAGAPLTVQPTPDAAAALSRAGSDANLGKFAHGPPPFLSYSRTLSVDHSPGDAADPSDL